LVERQISDRDRGEPDVRTARSRNVETNHMPSTHVKLKIIVGALLSTELSTAFEDR
jgi:hypothetical protein